ncbi:hypothetical protein [Candidatus Electrothrix sp.]|uniref:hypothetical protein n=1 Tax=Candidatus Electrothrix sp. TaxID=2170559 RepID=UPI004056DE13
MFISILFMHPSILNQQVRIWVMVPVLYFLIERSKELFAAGGKWYERKRVDVYLALAGEKERVQLDGR